MSQHDYIISDAVGSVFLSDLNSNLQAIVTDNSGTTEPTVTYANMVWADTSTSPPTIKRRNALNTAWVSENNMSGNVTISTNNSSAALTITQTGTGHALVIEDSTSPDTTPVVVDSNGNVGVGVVPTQKLHVFGTVYTDSNTQTTPLIVDHAANTDDARGIAFNVSGSNYGRILIPSGSGGAMGFWAGSAGAAAERMRINPDGSIGIGQLAQAGTSLRLGGNITGNVDSQALRIDGNVQSNVTGRGRGVITVLNTAAVNFSTNLVHFQANQGTIGAGSTVTSQYGFVAEASLTGASNNYGFYGNITSASGRYNFYASGTAPNYYAGDIRTNTTVTEATTVTNSNSSTTLTAANLLGHIVSGTPAAGINYTLPTGTDLDTAFQNLSNNQAFNWSVINLAAATHAITLLANTAHTIVGNAVVQANTSGTFRTRKTAANTFVTYRIS